MRAPVAARLAIAALATVVVVALLAAEHQRDDCEQAMQAVFVNAREGGPALDRAIDPVERRCAGSEPLTQLAAGLIALDRPRNARRLARTAAAREPESYVAWAVLAAADPGDARSARRARSLNPLASGAGP